MGSGFDVFNNLNAYLNKGDESFRYDSASDTPNSNKSQSKETSPGELEDDLAIVEINEISTTTARLSKRSHCGKVNDSIDLTEDSFMSPSKSRRKLADEIGGKVQEEVNLCEAAEQSVVVKGKRGRKPKKTTAKKVSYKKALELASTRVTNESITSKEPTTHQPPPPLSVEEMSIMSYDLTGDVNLLPYHSSAPLFQKDTMPINKLIKSIPIDSPNTSLESLELDLTAISLNIKINGKINRFKHNSDRRFLEIFKEIADKNKVPTSHVFLFDDKEKRIQPDDTPSSSGYKISTIYTCKIMDFKNTKAKNENVIELKFQSDKWKKPITLKVSKVDTFKSFILSLCKQVNYKPEQITSLTFDGDNIDMNETPLDLDFEGGEMLDCRVSV